MIEEVGKEGEKRYLEHGNEVRILRGMGSGESGDRPKGRDWA